MTALNMILAQATTAAKASATTVANESLWDLTLKGGWIMIPLALLAIVSIYIFFERTFAITGASREDKDFMQKIKTFIHQGKIEEARALCQQTNSPSSRMIEKGISRIGRPMNDVLVAVENVGNIEVSKLEKGFSWLATTAAGAPMLGFLGTVTGMVQAFMALAGAGSSANVTVLSQGIYEALVTTVAGLIVGIIAMFAYNFLSSRVKKVMSQLNNKTLLRRIKKMALKRQHDTQSAFSMSSMTDVVFLLLIFFMVTSTFVFPSALEVNLPQSSQTTQLKPSSRIYIDSLQRVWVTEADSLNEGYARPVDETQLVGFLQSVKNGSDSEHQFVALHADEAVPYGKIVEILDLGTKAGLKVVLATKPSSSSANEAPEQDVTQPAASATDAATPPNQ